MGDGGLESLKWVPLGICLRVMQHGGFKQYDQDFSNPNYLGSKENGELETHV